MIKKPQLYIQVHELMGRGLTVLQISQQLGINTKSVYKYTRMTKIDHLLTLEQKTLLAHLHIVAEQMSRGITDTKELFKKLEGQVKREWIARLTFNLRNEWKSKKKRIR